MNKPSISDRVFRLLVRLFPFDFQREFGTEMEDVFNQERRSAATSGLSRMVRLWWTTLASVLRVAPGEHFDVFRRDVRYAIRSMRRSPGFVLVATAALAIGIGANVTIFGFANALLFRPQPLPQSKEVIQVFRNRWANVPYTEYLRYRDENRTLAGLAAYSNILVNFRADGAPQSEWAMTVSGNYFSTIRIAAGRGRTIEEADDKPGAAGVVMLSDAFWRRRFGADPSVVGRAVFVNGAPFTIIGVTPESFNGNLAPLAPALWIPWNGPYFDANRSAMVIGRLRAGVTIEKAQADLSTIAEAIAQELFERIGVVQRGQLVTVYPGRVLHPELFAPLTAFGGGLIALTGLVLLAACMNISNLALARAASRRREISVRIALGAGRKQIVRQLLTESLLLAVVGGIAAAGVVYFVVNSVPSIPFPLQVPLNFEFVMDWRFAAFTTGLGLLTTLFCGLAPALQATRTDVITAMKDGASTTAAGRSRLRSAFIVGQVAVSALLLVVAALAVRSLSSPQSGDRGFDARKVLTASISLPPGYSRDRAADFYAQLLQRLETTAGVASANIAEQVPLTLSSAGRTYEIESGERASVAQNVVSPGHFPTLGIPILAGRDFTVADRAGAPNVCIINERLARRFWPGQNPVGKRLRLAGMGRQEQEWIEVVGLARDSKYTGISEDPKVFVYRPLGQQYAPQVSLLVKTKTDNPLAVAPAISAAVQALDPEIPIFAVSALEDATSISLLPMRIAAALSSALGVVALALGAIGIYGVVSYVSRNRTREIGIRIALGARPSHVVRAVTADVVRWTLLGLGFGLGVALAVSILLRSLIYGVAVGDAVSFGGIAILLFATAYAAAWIPARQASRIDPLHALREE